MVASKYIFSLTMSSPTSQSENPLTIYQCGSPNTASGGDLLTSYDDYMRRPA